MYEYVPKSDKKTEKLIFFGMLGLATLFYVGSIVPNMLFPALLQLIAFSLLTVAIVVISKFMICRYVYRIEPREATENLGEGYDFVIVQYSGKHVSTVCRCDLSSIVSMTHVTKENKRELSTSHKGKSVYRYVADLRADNVYFLEVSQYDRIFYLYILLAQL